MMKKFNLIACCDLNNGIGQKGDLPWRLPNEYSYFQFVTQKIDDYDLSFLDQFKNCDLNNNPIRKSAGDLIDNKNEKIRITNEDHSEDTNRDDDHKATDEHSVDNETRQESLFNEEDKILDQTNIGPKFGHKLCNCLIMGRLTWESIPFKYRPLKNRLNLVISRNCDAKCLNINSDHLFKSLEDALIYASKQDFLNEIFIVGGEQIYAESIRMKQCKAIYLTRINFKFNCDRFFPAIYETEFKEIDKFGLKDKVQFENNLEYEFKVYERIW